MRELSLSLLCVLIYWLFRRDCRYRELPSKALWIPAIWLFFIGTRQPTLWLSALGFRQNETTVSQVIFGLLVVLATAVLVKRNLRWGRFFLSNWPLMLLYGYLLATSLWAPDGADVVKRLYKDFGCVLMVLIFLTETSPWDAIKVVLVRLAYVILPLSVVLMKYFPALGRGAFRAGDTMYTGVATHKNTMGVIALVFALIVMADLFDLRRSKEPKADRGDILIRWGLLGTATWVLFLVDSKTAMLCLAVGAVAFGLTKRLAQLGSQPQVVVTLVAIAAVAGWTEAAFGVSTFVIEDLLGRTTTLTGRTDIWQMVREVGSDPWFGAGFMSFWELPEANAISQLYPGGMYTAHNGFLEMYLDGGLIGCVGSNDCGPFEGVR